MIKVLDTNVLLNAKNLDDIEGVLTIPSTVILELEHIKTGNRPNDLKWRSRVSLRHIENNPEKYIIEVVTKKNYKILEKLNLETTNDNLIISKAYELSKNNDVVFMTHDILAKKIAETYFGLKVEKCIEKDTTGYTGFKTITMSNEELSEFYSTSKKENKYDLNVNEYLIIKNGIEEVDAYYFDGTQMQEVNPKRVSTMDEGTIKPLDFYQKCIFDSIQRNTITSIRGVAGTGKTYLGLMSALSMQERGVIDKIVMVVPCVKVSESEELGFYTGSVTEKLLQNVGNFLFSKIDKMKVMNMISTERLVLLPLSDVRGYQTPANSILYVSEGQNINRNHAKLILQRVSDSCKVIIEGDTQQLDNKNYSGTENGLIAISEVFRECGDKDMYGEITLQKVRRSILAEIAELI